MVKTQSLTREQVCDKCQKVRDTISMPCTLGTFHEQPRIIIADQGFDANNVFLSKGGGGPQNQEITKALKTDDACNPPEKNHGTHIWGIICARAQGLMEGIAQSQKLDDSKEGRLLKDIIIKGLKMESLNINALTPIK